MTNDDIIKQKVNDFYTKQYLFTSINIANSIKKDGTWIRSHDVALWLQKYFEDLGDSYLSKTINVDNDSKQAFLYFPFFASSDNYNDRNLETLTPDEFEKLHGYSITDSQAQTTIKQTQTIHQQKTTATPPIIMPSRKIAENSRLRLRIPGAFIKAIGLEPGDYVSSKHSKIGLNLIPANLLVHADYRVSIPRSNITVDGKAVGKKPVHISLKDGKICFELAEKNN